jgi:hypothetical protein
MMAPDCLKEADVSTTTPPERSGASAEATDSDPPFPPELDPPLMEIAPEV